MASSRTTAYKGTRQGLAARRAADLARTRARLDLPALLWLAPPILNSANCHTAPPVARIGQGLDPRWTAGTP